MSELDMRIAEYSIAKLKNDWPFIKPEDKKPVEDIIEVNSRVDSVAMQSVFYGKKWQVAHLELASKALLNNEIDTFLKHMDILIYQYPYTKEIYDQVIHELLMREMNLQALHYLLLRYKLGANAFVSKWTGIIYYLTGERVKAINYLNESLRYDPDDPQTLYNLCMAYALEGQYENGREALRKCLEIAPDFPTARELYEEIKDL